MEAKTANGSGRGFIAGMIVAAVMALFFLSSDLGDLSGDSARYVLLAKALAEGRGYTDIEKPNAPPHTEFAPGTAVLAAPLYWIGGGALWPAKLVSVLALILCPWLLYLFFRGEPETRGPMTAALAAAALGSTPYLARFSNQIMSELPYLAASLMALVYVHRLQPGRDGARKWFGAGLLIGGAFLFRQTALALWAGSVLAAGLRPGPTAMTRAKAAAVLSLGFFLVAGAWFGRNLAVRGEADAVHAEKLLMARASDPFSGPIAARGMALRAGRGVKNYFRQWPMLMLDMNWPLLERPVLPAVSSVLLAPALLGFAARVRRRPSPAELYTAIYLFIILVWQSHYPRYLLPLVPLWLFYSAAGVKQGAGLVFRSGGRSVPLAAPLWLAAVIALNGAVFAGDQVLIRRSPTTPAKSGPAAGEFPLIKDLAGEIKWGYWHQYPDWLDSDAAATMGMRHHRFIAAAAWCGRHLPAEAVVVSRKPSLAAYYSDRMSIQYPAELDPDRFLLALRERGATHLLLDETSPEVRLLLRGVTAAHPGSFIPVFQLGNTVVAELDRQK